MQNLQNLSNMSKLGGTIRLRIGTNKKWSYFATGGDNPQTRAAMETGGAYERTRADLI